MYHAPVVQRYAGFAGRWLAVARHCDRGLPDLATGDPLVHWSNIMASLCSLAPELLAVRSAVAFFGSHGRHTRRTHAHPRSSPIGRAPGPGMACAGSCAHASNKRSLHRLIHTTAKTISLYTALKTSRATIVSPHRPAGTALPESR